MIVQAFLRWTETAKASDRAKAANALGRAYLHSQMGGDQQQAAALAMTYLLDDPSPRVRLALAQALSTSPHAPRAIVTALAEDQPEIACTVIAASPVLTEADLVDLVGRGDGLTRGVIASRSNLSRGVAAAIAEIGSEGEVILLLENDGAAITRFSLRRMAERLGHCSTIRDLLLDRDDLPADARHLLVGHVTAALANSDLVRGMLGQRRIDRVTREAEEAAAISIAGVVSQAEIPILIEHFRAAGRLTPALLVQALCTEKLDFFTGAVVALSGLDQKRVRPILATGRMHAVRALFESCGLAREVSGIFVEGVFLWRQAAAGGPTGSICGLLLKKLAILQPDNTAVDEIIEIVEKLQRSETRLTARAWASEAALAA
ncbi:DUF2336 domain-containing protein [Rhizobium deserti]|uniref:DUF2336 domain-containing protein n=1 Tax=Rhizobium deserti TaxID=2547961 RepID=A0A4R5ULD0_9HYPH|nr:DUF2336 domain-containing protein [Rhizobium deserti]TDK38632.1 DUF2336 domain-containing protein [Rhizobium deserti]